MDSKYLNMIPAGYMAKKIVKCPEWLKSDTVKSIYAVSSCVSKDFADYIPFWRHNQFWFFDSVEIIQDVSREHQIDLSECEFLYYEIYESEFDDKLGKWVSFQAEDSFGYDVMIPEKKIFLGFDIVSYCAGTSPECSVFSCSHLAEEVKINEYCLMDSFDEVKKIIESENIDKGEPGPYRILSVHRILDINFGVRI